MVFLWVTFISNIFQTVGILPKRYSFQAPISMKCKEQKNPNLFTIYYYSLYSTVPYTEGASNN